LFPGFFKGKPEKADASVCLLLAVVEMDMFPVYLPSVFSVSIFLATLRQYRMSADGLLKCKQAGTRQQKFERKDTRSS
jgi:hypothetical protein